uniref:Peptidase M43 pregnancy-associated plasma-A domain-containing protein n=1 Tax=Psilocybe cubensis TaxID=181762 RepID=A0A8H8CGW2_PSICU
MVASLSVAFTFAASLVAAVPRPYIRDAPHDIERHRGCGTNIGAARKASAERRFQSERMPAESENATATLDIYFHVVYMNETIEGGYVPDSQIQAQVDTMNADYNSTGISWNLVNITRIQNEDWFLRVAPNSTQELEMKTTYRQGNASTLNVYTVGLMEGDGAGLLGYATFPMDFNDAPTNDGVVLLFSTLPGSSSPKYNLGRTLTHESGHWCGLYHTFQGGCTGSGDEVDDTPAEESPAYGCPLKRDTCSSKGADPVQNFMDYTDDACMTNFTKGQAKRIKAELRTYRGVDV